MKNLNLFNLKSIVRSKARWLLTLIAILTLGVGQMWAAKQRYIYVGISNEYQKNKDGNNFGFNVWGGTSGGVKSLTWIQDNFNHDNRNYTIYRAYVYDDNNKAQFKGNDNWYDPGDGFSVTLNGTTNNAVFFSHSNDGWGGQFQENYQVTSTASLAASSTSVAIGTNVTLTPSLSSNATYNEIKSTSYSVTTNPESAGSVTSAGVFSATKAGSYTVQATVTYNAKDFSGITKTATATRTITVYATITFDKEGGLDGISSQNTYYNEATSNIMVPSKAGFVFGGYWTEDDGTGTQVIGANGAWIKNVSGFTDNSATAKWRVRNDYTLHAKWIPVWQFYNNTTHIADFTRVSDTQYECTVTLNASNAGQMHFLKDGTTYYFPNGVNPTSADNELTQGEGMQSYTTMGLTNTEYTLTLKYTSSKWYLRAVASSSYSVTYYGNNNTSGTAPVDASSPYAPGANVTVKTKGDLARTGYTFTGWNTKEGGDGTPYSENGTISSIGASYNLYAQWSENMTTVTINVNPAGAGTLTVDAAAFTAGSTTTAGVTTSHTVVAAGAGDYAFSSWSATGNATGTNSTNTYTLKGNGSGGSGILTANFTTIPCKLYKLSAAKDGGITDKGAMSYDPTEHAYYKDITTDASPYYFRFYYNNSAQYCTDWSSTSGGDAYTSGKQIAANGSKVDCNQSVGGWGDKPAMYYSGESGTTIRIWFDYQNKKVWITADKDKQYVLRGANADDASKADGMPGWSATTSYFVGLASGNTGTISCSLNAGEWYHLKVYDMYNKTWYGTSTSGEQELTDGTLSTMGSYDDFYFRTTVADSYTFTLDRSSGTKIKVDFPVSHQVTYGVGTSYTSMGSVTTTPSITSGSYQLAGTSITFTATPNLGYKFVGWYSTSACSGDAVSTNAEYATTISGTTTLYAKFETRNLYIHADWLSWGTAQMTQSTVDRAIYTYEIDPLAVKSGTPSTAEGGHHFQFVNNADNPNDHKAYNYYGVQTPTGSGYLVDGDIHLTHPDNATIQFDLTRKSKITITLTLQTIDDATKPTLNIDADPYYTITIAKSGPDAGFASLSPSAGSTVEARASVASSAVTVGVNTGYTRTDWTATSGITITSASSNSTTVKATADGTLTANVRPNTYTVAFNANNENYEGTATGTTAPIENKAYNAGSYTLTANGFSRTGYTFAGWNTDPDGTSGTDYSNEQSITSPLTAVDGATVTLYAKWTGNEHTVSFNYGTGSGATASKDVTFGSAYGVLPDVTAPSGCVFSGWFTAPTGGTLVEAETLVTTDNDHTLYARITQRDRVYFYNNLGWSDVYVTYDAYWDDNKGTGNDGKIYHHMTQIAGTDIWYDDIPNAVLSSWKYFIAFNSQQLGTIGESSNYGNFDKGDVVFRHDFDSYATMFVPERDKAVDTWKKYDDKCTYYSSTWTHDAAEGGHGENYRQNVGYWMRYNDIRSGYTITGNWDSWANSTALMAATPGETTFTMTKTLAANTTYDFLLYKEFSTNSYNHIFTDGTPGTMTSGNSTNWAFWSSNTKYSSLNSNHTKINTTVAGEYTFQLKTGTDGRLLVSVIYPFAVNDYRVTYSWTESATGKSHSSEIIKGEDAFEKKISVFVHSSSATGISGRTLQIEKCTEISGSGVPTWTSGNTIDISSVDESGVYNFVISKTSGNEPTGAFSEKYEGNYYIRTESSEGGWNYYKEHSDNIMTYSDYSLTQTLSDPYSHYYCRYIENTGMDITYQIATDYSPCVSDIFVGDATIGGIEHKTLPSGHPANIRFTWNEKTNALRRAYLKSAQGGGNTRFLVLHGDDRIFNASTGEAIPANVGQSLAASELLFSDLGNWIYQVELKAFPSATVKLIAQYNGSDRYLVGDADHSMTIMGGTPNETKYAITAVYDFKTNRLMTVWTPSGAIGDDLKDVDMLLIRHAQENATSVTFSGSGKLTTKKVYGAIELRRDELVGHVASWTTDSRPLLKYMISFPFDVNISDVFGLNTRYGDAYVIQKYDGADRAARGFFRGDGTTTFWKDMEQNEVMRANVGYCVIFDNDYLNDHASPIWENKGAESKVYLYFPSVGNVGAISNSTKEITVTGLPCNIDREFTVATRTLNHKYTDSNWNLIGVPIFQNSTGALDPATITYPENTGDQTGSYGPFYYFYDYNVANNRYSIASAAGYNFKTMYSYMLQYAGTVTFTGSTPSSVAARRIADTKKYEIELQVLRNDEEVINRAFVNLKENACDTFALNEDVYMSPNSAAVNIYTLAGNYDVAANILSIDNHIVPVGVEVSKAGNYSFSMPSDFDGTVVLVDNFDGSRTDLSLGDYSVALPKGTIEDRFTLEINIERGSATDIEGIEGGTIKDGKAHKFVRDGILYILRDGVIYDAMGKRVK